MKKVSYALIVIGLILIINSLAHSIYDLWSKQELLTQAQSTLDREKKENADLKKQLTRVQDRAFIESEARDSLFMVRPGETNVIIPKSFFKSKEESKDEQSSENWQKWLKLFFPS